MSYYGSNHYTANHYASKYYGPRGVVVVQAGPTGAAGFNYRDQAYHQNKEDEYVLELVFKKFMEAINA